MITIKTRVHSASFEGGNKPTMEDVQDVLNRLGKEGWELVSVQDISLQDGRRFTVATSKGKLYPPNMCCKQLTLPRALILEQSSDRCVARKCLPEFNCPRKLKIVLGRNLKLEPVYLMGLSNTTPMVMQVAIKRNSALQFSL